MKPFSRVLVGLDFSYMDSILIGFVGHFMRINPFINKVYFIHIEEDLQEKNGVAGNGSENTLPCDEMFKHRMKEEVDKYYVGKKVDIQYKVVEGDPIKQLCHWAEIKHIDLVLAGKKKRERGRGIVMEKLARKCNRSILFVPENYPRRFRKILIPIDFSRRTDMIFEVAALIGKYMPGTKFICQHVVDVPHGYTRIGKTYEEFAEIMVRNAENRWRQYKKAHTPDVENLEPAFTLNKNGSIANIILNYSREQQVDMIIIGTKKQTDASVFLLGSVGEELISRDKDILLLLVKDKKTEYGFFRAMGKV